LALTSCHDGGHPGICDSHVHVFDPARFGYVTPRRFTPGQATAEDLERFHKTLGVDRAVLVQPSVYGSDHRCLIDALRYLGAKARGVCVLDPSATTHEITQLSLAGCIGARVNLAIDDDRNSEVAAARVRWLSSRIPSEWHVQVHAHLATIAAMSEALATLPHRVVLDHFGLPEGGVSAAAWPALLALLNSGNVFVKMSASYLVTEGNSTTAEELIRSLVATAPSRLLWGTNWPHTQGPARAGSAPSGEVEPFRVVDDSAMLARMAQWLGPAIAHLAFVENPQRLYRFPESIRQLAAP
jgi:predicted TIM-barrel fold metal-dependent hydrolase